MLGCAALQGLVPGDKFFFSAVLTRLGKRLVLKLHVVLLLITLLLCVNSDCGFIFQVLLVSLNELNLFKWIISAM